MVDLNQITLGEYITIIQEKEDSDILTGKMVCLIPKSADMWRKVGINTAVQLQAELGVCQALRNQINKVSGKQHAPYILSHLKETLTEIERDLGIPITFRS